MTNPPRPGQGLRPDRERKDLRMSHDRKYDAPEFTNLAHACNECDRDVPEDDAGPSCGAHILHIECGPFFGCNHCYLVRAEIP